MIGAIDVYYFENRAKTVLVLFDWEDEKPKEVIIDELEGITDYEPGSFYKRELPCIKNILNKIDINKINILIVDSHVYIDNHFGYGLGGHVWDLLNQKIPIIGVAKNSFANNKKTCQELLRGKSNKPLFISTIGIDLQIASNHIKNMKGEFRIPDILKKLDQITKTS